MFVHELPQCHSVNYPIVDVLIRHIPETVLIQLDTLIGNDRTPMVYHDTLADLTALPGKALAFPYLILVIAAGHGAAVYS